jgi:pimeloyl-ACP methyl ester carboxylesterase
MTLAAPYLTDPPLYLNYLPGKSDRLVVSFSGVGLPEEDIPRVEAANLAGWQGENHVLFVADASRSWMNTGGLTEKIEGAVRKLAAEINPRRIVAFGNSMGGSAAMIFAKTYPLDALIAIAPQYSIHPEEMPNEDRWTHYAGQITDWRHRAVPSLVGRPTEVVILHGSANREMMHARRFAQGANIHHFIFKDFAHGIAQRLKRKDRLEPIITPLILGDIAATCRAAEAAGGVAITEFRRLHKEMKQLRKATEAKEVQL